MFSKKLHADVKKSTQKFQDCKKDTATRLKHLRLVLDNVNVAETKAVFETNSSQIYYIFYDQFITVEHNVRQRAHKSQREEFDAVLYIFEKILIYLPELLARKWQCHSIGRLMKKLLHPGNNFKLRRDAMRLFLLWYQALGEDAPQEVHCIFSCLVPGLHNECTLESIIEGHVGASKHSTDFVAVNPVEILAILPPQSGEKPADDITNFFLQSLLNLMVSEVVRIEWQDKSHGKQQRCFQFLFERFKKHYLKHIFPNFSWVTSLYKPKLDLPDLRYDPEEDNRIDFGVAGTSLYKTTVIYWICNFTQNTRKVEAQTQTVISTADEMGGAQDSNSLVLTESNTTHERESVTSNNTEDNLSTSQSFVRDTLYSSRENVNFVHEIFRQAFLLSFHHATFIKKVILVYKDWIENKNSEKPPFMLEPYDGISVTRENQASTALLNMTSMENLPNPESNDITGYRDLQWRGRLRNDSYLGAIHRELLHVRAGLQNTLQIFITNAANVFLLENKFWAPQLLDEQIDLCKRVLNIYRYMVMKLAMDQKTWEQLLLVLLQITSLVLKENPPVRKEETIGGRLASILFQTLIVTWIRANMYVVISAELWDQFLGALFTLTRWEQLITEWSKTMETLTRVLARLVYGLELNDLPLDRLSEQKQKKRRGRLNPSDPRASFSRSWSRHGLDVIAKAKTEDTSKNNLMVGSIGKVNARDKEGAIEFQVKTATNATFYMSGNSSIPISRQDRLRLSSGDHGSRSNSESERTNRITRSVSEGNLCKNQSPSRRSSRESPTSVRNGATSFTRTFELKSNSSIEHEVERIMSHADECLKRQSPRENSRLRRRSKSLESLRVGRTSSTPSCMSESSECRSRTPSPSPSSGLESNSIKDSPMQIDVLAGDNSSASELLDGNREEQCSVMAGGTARGWLPDVAVVLWKRMLGALSDVNQIKDPEIHAQVFETLIDLYDTLVKIRENQGVTQDNQSTPPLPEYIPPLHLFSPWLFKAITLPDQYEKGQLHAYRLLCSMTTRRHDIPLVRDHLILFYRALHQGLVGTNQNVINTIVKYCGPQFFSCNLPGSTMLLLDFIYAADTIISSNDIKGMPRTEVVSILGSLLCFPHLYKDMQVLQPNASEFVSMTTKDSMDHIVNMLLKAVKREPAGLARCIAISSLGIYLYGELVHRTYHAKLKEAITVLLTALKSSTVQPKFGLVGDQFNNKTVAQVACDMLLLLGDHSEALLEHYPDMPRKIMEVLASTLNNLLPNNDALLNSDDKKLLISIMFCLGEWCMRMPKKFLLEEEDGKTLLLIVFKVLNAAVLGKWSVSNRFESTNDIVATDFDPNIQLDNLKEGATSSPGSPKSQMASPNQELIPLLETSPSPSVNSSPSGERKDWSVIKLAARTIMNHLVNHLHHFPMVIGAACLTSLVTEHDDIDMHVDELSTEIFRAPNVQFFVLNNSKLISFVELPLLEVPGGGVTAGLTTAKSQVRVITRDMSGKFCWDCSILHGPPEYQIKTPSITSSVELSSPFQSFNSSMENNEAVPSLNFDPPSPTLAVASSPLRQMQRHRPPDVLPVAEDTAEDMDNLDDLLQFIGHTSPECLDKPGQLLNSPSLPSVVLSPELQNDTMSAILYQRSNEVNFIHRHNNEPNSMKAKPEKPKEPHAGTAPFYHSHFLLNQLGFMSWEKRSQVDLLKKNEKLLRELRNLDNQKCRETHKIAVIYVAEGQEDKNSLLLNSGGSQAYEEFVAALAWEVELETHTGFMGGLQKNKSTGETAPYYATSFTEVIFHVATRMPGNSEESKLQKLRHLGNDEVHIVWSEHYRDYRRGIIATEFCDVLIVIYPLPNRMFRIQISRKPEVPYFGPLFNGTIVDYKVLPGLVRATALNASRAKRSMLPYYQNFYEERAKALDTVIQNHKEPTIFEVFTAHTFAPAHKSFQFALGRNSFNKSCDQCQQSSSNLAAALIDSHTSNSSSPPHRSRPLSLSTSEHPSPRDQNSRVATHSFSYTSNQNPSE